MRFLYANIYPRHSRYRSFSLVLDDEAIATRQQSPSQWANGGYNGPDARLVFIKESGFRRKRFNIIFTA